MYERPPAAARAVPFHYTQTESFVTLLQRLGASLLVTTYQANKLLVARATGEGSLAEQVLQTLARFRLNGKHLDVVFQDGSRWEARFNYPEQAR